MEDDAETGLVTPIESNYGSISSQNWAIEK